jgi:hypothetical protein
MSFVVELDPEKVVAASLIVLTSVRLFCLLSLQRFHVHLSILVLFPMFHFHPDVFRTAFCEKRLSQPFLVVPEKNLWDVQGENVVKRKTPFVKNVLIPNLVGSLSSFHVSYEPSLCDFSLVFLMLWGRDYFFRIHISTRTHNFDFPEEILVAEFDTEECFKLLSKHRTLHYMLLLVEMYPGVYPNFSPCKLIQPYFPCHTTLLMCVPHFSLQAQ